MIHSNLWQVIEPVLRELERAEMLHPHWPADPIHALSIVTEEVGEAVREANDLVYAPEGPGRGAHERLRIELVQSAAMCLRALIHLDGHSIEEVR